jgi:hypothetical protein
MSTSPASPRVWLVAGLNGGSTPTDLPTVRDDLMRIWTPETDDRYSTGDGRHTATWAELRARHDLVEVTH